MNVIKTEIPDVLIFEPKVFGDERGFFFESFNQKVFEEAVREGDLVRIAEADESFHFVIYDAADNDKLKELLNNLRENMYRYRMEYSKDIDTRKSLIEEHRQIFDSFVKGDFSRGLSVVERHIKNQETAVLNKLSQETF